MDRDLATVNNALAAVDDLYIRRGLGPANAARAELPDNRAQGRRSPRDRAIALVPFYAGTLRPLQLVGEFTQQTTSVSYAKGGRSTTHATQRERVLDVADLAALPEGHAIVLAAGAPPALARTLPWMTGPRANEVRLSLREHDPAAAATLNQAATSLDEVAASPARRLA